MKFLRKYGQISKITMSNSLVYFWNFLSKNIFFVFIMFIYLMLWKNIYGQKGSIIGGLTINQMIWYLIVTELVTLSRTDIHLQVNEDVKSGNIAYLLNKPYNYVLYCFSYFVGEVGIKLLTNGIIGILIGLIYAGSLRNFSFITPAFYIFIINIRLLYKFFYLYNISINFLLV